jgi:hypothetical protein
MADLKGGEIMTAAREGRNLGETGGLGDFLNPKSMLTPGVAGGMAMLITNTLCRQFPTLPLRWTALVLSFALGLLVFSASMDIAVWQRLLYYVLNSLIIFSVGAGANYLGTEPLPPSPPAVASAAAPFVSGLLPSSIAHAQPPPAPTPVPPTPTPVKFFRPW